MKQNNFSWTPPIGGVQLSVKCLRHCGRSSRARSVWRLQAAPSDYSRQMLRLGEQLPHKISCWNYFIHRVKWRHISVVDRNAIAIL